MIVDVKRINQLLYFGWKHASLIAQRETKNIIFRLRVFGDILACFHHYKMWSNQYLKESFYKLSKEERETIGNQYRQTGILRDEWYQDFVENRKFLARYTSRKFELPQNREKRNLAYQKRYNMGKGCFIEYNVELSRQHYLPGTIKIGNNVLLAKNVFIDYSGEVIIEDGVKLANGVIIESHHRDLEAYRKGQDVNIPTTIHIAEDAYIGSRAIIMSSCHYIGKNARVGAGAVVTKDVPDNAVVVGVPAKVIRYLE